MTLNPSSAHFSVMWSNNDQNWDRSMTEHALTLRDAISCSKLHLDQVHIIFRPSSDIPSTQFVPGDTSTLTWRAETSQLLVRTTPGERHHLYATSSDDTTSNDVMRQVHRPVTYSAALTVTPDSEGAEDMWCRTYRPVRDLPVAHHLFNTTELRIELLFPLLMEDTRTTLKQIPNYRIIKVLCEFSLDK